MAVHKEGRELPQRISPLDSFREQEDCNHLQQRFIENFEERLQLKKSLIELKDTNTTNMLDIEHLQMEVDKSEKISEVSLSLQNEINIIQENIKANFATKESLERAVLELDLSARNLIEEFPRKITKQERRNLLSLLIQSQNLELQNMELEIQLKIRDKIIMDQQRLLKGMRKLNIS